MKKAQKNKPRIKNKSVENKVKRKKIYSDLIYKKRVLEEKRARAKAEEMAKLPKEPVKRFLARMHPKRTLKAIFSLDGLKFALKSVAFLTLTGIILTGALFLYYRKDLNEIKLSDLKVTGTTNTYLDRHGKLLWEDKGDGDYRLAVKAEDISKYMRWATVAIEDKKFYNHPGVDLFALARAALSIITRKGVQGGSTLTQQLIKQVYFADEAKDRGLGGIPRKIKEAILALEVEKMYNKEQIITMYLNESPYGGRRNGVESGARTYFGKTAKDLDIAESALLAAIPNNPAVLNPYNTHGHKQLIARQQKTIDVMVEMGKITAEEAKAAKEINILDKVRRETTQYSDIKAPHFVVEIKRQLEQKYGVKTMRAGGYVIKTTLDLRAQQAAEAAVAEGAKLMYENGSNNISLSSVDVETGQVIAMVGSVNWHAPVYGQVNAANSLLEPGSSIKPIFDFAALMQKREGQNFGPGTILRDENIDGLYCRGNTGPCQLRNASGRFYGNITIRQSLGNSFNIGAVKALYINGVEDSLKVARGLGDLSWCKGNKYVGLSTAIGSGCTVRQIEHTNAYASLARGGVYKPLSYVLEIKNASGEILERWKDQKGERAVDEQVAYMISDILSDKQARLWTFGGQSYSFGFSIPGVWTASKTGTTTTTSSAVAKDSWMMSYSPVVATGVWNGNHDGKGMRSGSNTIVRRVVNNYMSDVHKNVYKADGKWTENQRPIKPAGIKTMAVAGKTDIWPSWYTEKSSGIEKVELVFNKINKKLAAVCTLEKHKIKIEVTKIIDPMTKKEIWNVPDGYDRENEDDCSSSASEEEEKEKEDSP